MGRWDNDRNWAIVDALREVGEQLQASPAEVALAWLLSKPAVDSVIIGVRTVAQLDANLKAAALELPAEAVERLDAASQPEYGYPYDFIKGVDGTW